ncbi:MAG TPA: hypothetical protein DDW46_02155 [Dehalococcoidia bacterium]|nr:hypothetical protein [Dehalococcoidia bacterium]
MGILWLLRKVMQIDCRAFLQINKYLTGRDKYSMKKVRIKVAGYLNQRLYSDYYKAINVLIAPKMLTIFPTLE